jgi:hypothetical protein
MAGSASTIRAQDYSGRGGPPIRSKNPLHKPLELARQATGGTGRSTQSEKPESHPTVLVVADEANVREPLAHSLRQANYLVLEADSLGRMFDVIRFHSRPIHVVLLALDVDDPALEKTLKCYRSGLQVLLLRRVSSEDQSVLAAVRELLKLPRSAAAHAR